MEATLDTDFSGKVNGHAPGLETEAEETEDVELDELDRVVLHLRRIGRPVRLEGTRYVDPRCPICRRSEVLIADTVTRELYLRCRDPLCERSDLLARYGIGSRSVQAEARERAIVRRLEELIIDHLARQRFATWLDSQQEAM